MPEETVVDTSVLQKANAPITPGASPGPSFRKRLRILEDIRRGTRIVLYSGGLVVEYGRKVPEPRNDYVQAFFEIIANPGRAIYNWPRWTGAHREKCRKCRFPAHDVHVLRTALRPQPSTIIAEERPMLAVADRVFREFRVRIRGI